ncbi:MAG: glycosyltransferase family 39 protein [Candidatus Saganbacteria bacterium]|nr:glycosyltransferase family 39 protein [Candidatus Saganbacteria bacterium]
MKPREMLLVILALFIAASFLTLPRNPLLTDDASTYALAAKNMVVHGEWLAPLVTAGDPSSFFDKPPAGLWLLAWFPALGGVNELTIHFPNALYFTLFLALFYYLLATLAAKKIALYAALIAATSLCLVVYSRAPKLDLPLTVFVMLANLSLYAVLKKAKPAYLLIFSAALALGFLTKSGFGLLPPLLTLVFLLIFNSRARKTLFSILVTRYSLLSLSLFALTIGSVLCAQAFVLKDQWLPYLKSITLASKYNAGYLGFGFYYSIIGFLLIAVFPWTPLALTGIKLPWKRPNKIPTSNIKHQNKSQDQMPKSNSWDLGLGNCLGFCRLKFEVTSRKLNLNTFCSLWFWSNFLFLLFFYKISDLRTFVIFVPPLAILAALKLIGLARNKRRGCLIGFQIFFLALFAAILIALLIKPVNPQGFSLVAALPPLALFVVSLAFLAFFLFKPSPSFLALCFALVCLAYAVLFYNTKPLADAFNPDVTWPGIIREYRAEGFKFYIYRPHDRNLFYSPDLLYVDFMAGPADRYFWEGEELKAALAKGEALVLSDTRSWRRLAYRGMVSELGRDSYSTLVKVF